MKKIYILFTAMLLSVGMSGAELVVADGTATNANIIVSAGDGDCWQHNQVIYPAAYLEDLKGKSIKSMTFHLNSKADKALTAAYSVSLGISEDGYFATSGVFGSYSYNSSEVTKVYEGTLDPSQATIKITFSDAYMYEEGNLLLDIQTTTKGNYTFSETNFAGMTTSSPSSVYNAHINTMQTSPKGAASFLPKTTFEYDGEAVTPCVKPKDLEVSTVESSTANLSWNAGGEETEWEYVCVEKGAAWDWNGAERVNVSSAHVENLNPVTEYVFYVRSSCDGGRHSVEYPSIGFKTQCGVYSQLPWEENFDKYSSKVLPDCWSYPSSTDTAVAYLGKLQFSLRTEGNQYIKLPEFSIRLDTLAISFTYSMQYNFEDENVPTISLSLGYYDEGNTFKSIQSFSYKKNETAVNNLKLESLGDQVRQLAFHVTSTGLCNVMLDNVKIHEPIIETGVESIQPSAVSVQKVIRDGQIVIIREGKEYNLLGGQK